MGKDLKGKELGAGYSQRKDGRYCRAYRYDGKQKFVYGNTMKECKEKYKAVLVKIEKGEMMDKSKITLDEYFDRWRQQLLEKNAIKPSTYATYTNQYFHIKKAFGWKKLDKITTNDVKTLQIDLVKQGFRPKSINSIMGLLSSVFKEIIRDELLVKNPCVVLRPIKEKTDTTRNNARALTEQEQALFLQYAEGSWYYNAICLLFATGMRSGELRGLQWRDYDKKNGVLHIERTATVDKDGKTGVDTPKTANSKRDIPLNDTIIAIIKRQKEQNEAMFGGQIVRFDDYIFKSVHGKMISRNMLKKTFNTICNKIQTDGKNFDRISPHACRHTFITQNIMKGYNEYVVKDIVGHSHSARVTVDVYLHKDKGEMEKFMKELDKAN